MSGNPSSSGAGGGGGPCGACKFLRRKCVAGCIFAPYFDSEQGASHFAAVHKVFGASNVSKLLLHIPVHKRPDAVVTICYEAQARLRDPVYGCVAHIFALQQQVVTLQAELSYLQAHLTSLEVPTPSHPHPAPPLQPPIPPPQLSIADLPSATTLPATYDLSNLFDPIAQQTAWAIQQQRSMDPRLLMGGGGGGSDRGPSTTHHHPGPHSNSTAVGGGGNHDLQVMARELLRTQDDDRGSSLIGHLPRLDPRK